MVGASVVFGWVVSQVCGSWCPSELELVLVDSIFNPVEAHVNCFGTFLFELTVDDAVRGAIVSCDCSGWLGVSQFDECASDGDCLLCIEEDSCNFCLGGGCHNIFDYLGKYEDGAIEEGAVGVGEVVISSGAAACLRTDEVGGVAVKAENHVARAVDNFGVGLLAA